MSNKVVAITLNPALDLTGHLDRIQLGEVNLIAQSHLGAAGKGVNVARVLSDLGAQVTVTGFLGQDNQTIFCQLFEQIGVQDAFIRIAGATRINVKLVEKTGAVSDLNFPSIQVNEQAIAQFEQLLDELARDHEFFILAGSLPNGVSPQLCADWIKKLTEKGKKVFFDSSRDALIAGVNATPWLIKPNEEELAQLVQHPVQGIAARCLAAEQIAQQGIEHIVISMGEQGTLWLNQGQWLQATPPTMPVVSTVGAGDTLVAGLCWGHMQAMPKPELLCFATALSALAVTQIGVGVPDLNAVTQLQQQVQLNTLN